MSVNLLETVREYAEERLVAAGRSAEHAVRDAHADYFLAMAEAAAPALQGRDQALWLDCLETERANLTEAFAWLTARGTDGQTDGQTDGRAFRLAVATCRFWTIQGPLSTGRVWLERCLVERREKDVEDVEDTRGRDEYGIEAADLRAAALHALGGLAHEQGDLVAAKAALEEALRLRRRYGDEAGVAASLNNLGLSTLAAGNAVAARAHFAESLTIKRRRGDAHGATTTLNNLALARKMAGDYSRAAATAALAARLARSLGDDSMYAKALANQSDALVLSGCLGVAEEVAEKSLAIRRAQSDLNGMGQATGILGSIAQARGDGSGALARYREALGYFRAFGAQAGMLEALTALALLQTHQGDCLYAVRTLAVVEATGKALGLQVWNADEELRVIAVREVARGVMGEDRYADACAEGRRLSLAAAARQQDAKQDPTPE